MATYTVTTNLSNNLNYDAEVISSAHAPATSCYFKQGDIIRATVIHPSGSTYYVRPVLPDVNGANPDPSVESNEASGYTYQLEWTGNFENDDDPPVVTSSASDYFTQWFFIGNTQAGSTMPGTASHSKKAVFRKVSASLGISSSTMVAGGGTLTLTASNILGLASSTGTTDHRLWVYLTEASGNVVTTVGTNGVAWDSTSDHVGKVSPNDTSTVLTVHEGLPAGTYTVHLGHYGAGGSGNAFTGSDHRLASVTFTKASAEDDDTTPVGFNLGDDQTGLATNQTYTTLQVTVTGITATTTVTTSGDGNPAVKVGNAEFTTGATTVTNDQTVDFRFFSSGNYSTAHTATLNIGGVTDSVTITTGADPDSPTEGASGTASYGIRVFNASGNETFGPNFKVPNLVANGTATIPARDGATYGSLVLPIQDDGDETFEGFTSTNADKIDIIVLVNSTNPALQDYSMERLSGNDNGKVKFTNLTYGDIPIDFYVVRTS